MREKNHTYGNSWTYVTQGVFGIGCNDLGYKYYDGKNLSMIGIYPKKNAKDIIMMYWIRPMGETVLEVISNCSSQIKEKYGISCYVKKIFQDQYDFLISRGFRNSVEFPWHQLSHAEDDTYPELILDREYTLNEFISSKKINTLGNVFRHVSKLIEKNNIVSSLENFNEHAWMIVNKYFENRNIFKNKLNFSTPFDYYNMIFNNRDSNNIVKNIVYLNGKPIGFYLLEHSLNLEVSNFYATIAIRDKYKYITDYMFYEVLRTCDKKYINLGGSEDNGIHNFKMKYKPVKKNVMYWVTNYFS